MYCSRGVCVGVCVPFGYADRMQVEWLREGVSSRFGVDAHCVCPRATRRLGHLARRLLAHFES